MQVIIKYKSKSIKVNDVKKVYGFEKGIGLMFRSREECPAMFFEFQKSIRIPIHSFFVFFPFAAVWLDNQNKIVDLKIVKPFRLSISSKKPFYKLIEIPLNKEYKKEIQLLFKKM